MTAATKRLVTDAEAERLRAGAARTALLYGDGLIDALLATREALIEVLEATHGTAQAMADLDSWIAEECGMEDDGDNWVVPAARALLTSLRGQPV